MGARSKTTATQQPSLSSQKIESAKSSGHYPQRPSSVDDGLSTNTTRDSLSRDRFAYIALCRRLDEVEGLNLRLSFTILIDVKSEFSGKSLFTGKIDKVTLELKCERLTQLS